MRGPASAAFHLTANYTSSDVERGASAREARYINTLAANLHLNYESTSERTCRVYSVRVLAFFARERFSLETSETLRYGYARRYAAVSEPARGEIVFWSFAHASNFAAILPRGD